MYGFCQVFIWRLRAKLVSLVNGDIHVSRADVARVRHFNQLGAEYVESVASGG